MPRQPENDVIMTRPKIAIIGAGWAGLSAAAHLVEHADVALYEAGRVAGGRARGVPSDEFSFLDNGQHLLIGAYQAVFRLLDKTGMDWRRHFYRQPLRWYLHDGLRFEAAWSLPAPLNLLTGLLRGENASLGEKMALVQQLKHLQAHHKRQLPDQSVLSWLEGQGVSRKWLLEFWQPMVWGALNTPLDEASLNVLCNVLADGVWAGCELSDYFVPRVDLTRAFAMPIVGYLQQHGAAWLPNQRVKRVLLDNHRGVRVDGERFDGAIIATAPYHVESVLPPSLGDNIRFAVNSLQYYPITTVYLKYARAFRLPALMTGFAEGTAQWLIDRRRLTGANEIAAVVSLSHRIRATNVQWAQRVHRDVLRVCPQVGKPVAWQVITEKRATIASHVNRVVPTQARLNQYGIWLAGDWLHPRYPATLEAAVQSGAMMAQAVLERFKAA